MSTQQINYSRPNTTERKAAVAQALASVRAEGLEPSLLTRKRMTRYARGEITVEQMQSQTLKEARSLTSTLR